MPNVRKFRQSGKYRAVTANIPRYNIEGARHAFCLIATGHQIRCAFPKLYAIGGVGFGAPVIALLKEKGVIGADLVLTQNGKSLIRANENPFDNFQTTNASK